MDRSEGAKPKGHKVALFQARGAGKPCVAQPPQRDNKKREDRRAGEITTERMPTNQEGQVDFCLAAKTAELSARPWAQPAA